MQHALEDFFFFYHYYFSFWDGFSSNSAWRPSERQTEGTGPHKGARDSSHGPKADACECRSHYFQFAISPSSYRKVHYPLYCLWRRAGEATNLKRRRGGAVYEQPGNFFFPFFFFGPPSLLPQNVNHCFSGDHLLHTTHHPLLQRAVSQIMAGKSTNGWKMRAGGGLLRKLAKESLDLRISLGGMAVAL